MCYTRRYYTSFNPNRKFGKKSTYDPRGVGARCCFDWSIKEPIFEANKLQADYFKKVKSQVGKILAP